jgi:hypothetical protein
MVTYKEHQMVTYEEHQMVIYLEAIYNILQIFDDRFFMIGRDFALNDNVKKITVFFRFFRKNIV